jgi:hypothetical protein
MEPWGTSEKEGASTSKTLSCFHFAWYFFSIAIRESRFSVCEPIHLATVTQKKIEKQMEGEGQANIFQLQGVFGTVARVERSRRGGGCHDVLCKIKP